MSSASKVLVLREVAQRYSAVARRMHEALQDVEVMLPPEGRAVVDEALDDVKAQLAAVQDLLEAAQR